MDTSKYWSAPPLKWSRARFQPVLPLGKDGKRITASPEHLLLSRKAAAEGIVLLKNEKSILPLKKGAKVAVFGKGSIDYVMGGGGSGDVFSPYIRNIYEGLKIKESEGKLQVFDELAEFTDKFTVEQNEKLGEEYWRKDYDDTVVPEDLAARAREFADTAIFVFSRRSYEGFDRNDFEMMEGEKALLKQVSELFDNVIVLLNICGMVNLKPFAENEKVTALVACWLGGTEGGLAAADVLTGDVNPSAKLVDTFADSIDAYPSTEGFNESEYYVNYTDDIYVGYRYFETIPGAAEKVVYPFGFGLSYTTFEISGAKASSDGKIVRAECDVKNTGDTAGREVVQLYYSAPDGVLGKPARELAGFKKTGTLQPGDTEHIVIEFDVNDMASYDDVGKLQKSAYLLEKGEYNFYLGNSVRDVQKLDYAYFVEEQFRVTEQLSEHCAPPDLNKRLKSDGTYEEIPTRPITLYPFNKKKWIDSDVKPPKEKAMLIDVVNGKVTLDEFIAQLNNAELARLTGIQGGQPNTGCANTWGVGNLEKFGIPNLMTADGPAGLRFESKTGVATTAWPMETAIACSWDPQIAFEVGKAAALEVKENNIDIWLAPGMNIHRSPLCGRNFEYFAEDPVLTAAMAIDEVKGIQSVGIAATIKHFCCNNKEVNRNNSDSRVSERALREIYLKAFEKTVKAADPWLLMTSYNKLNSVYTSANYELITDILRGEWGYKGCVTTDWWTGALTVFEIKAGNDIKMPFGFPEAVEEALANCTLVREDVEATSRRILNLIMKLGD